MPSLQPRPRAEESRPRRLRTIGVIAAGAAAAVALGTPAGVPAHASGAPAADPGLVTPATQLRAGVMPIAHGRQSAPSGAHLTYYGGKVISNVRVIQVLYGSGTYTPEVADASSTDGTSIASFYSGVTNSTYYDWLSEYDTNINAANGHPGTNQLIGRGTFSQQVQITPAAANNSSPVDDTNIQAELQAQISAGHLPAPDGNTLYAVYFRAGQTITQGGSTSGVDFCAYHGTVAAGSTPEFYYSVLPDFTTGGMTSGCGNGTRYQNETSVSSHELVEATTDAEVGLATSNAPPLAWYDNTNGEIGDICNGQQQAIQGGDGHTYTVQQEFSNQQNNCVVSGPAAGNDFALSLSPTSGSLVRGSSTTSHVSTTATSGSGTVTLAATVSPAGPTATLSPSSVAAGGGSTLTIATTSSVAAGPYTVTVTGTEGSKTHSATYSLTVTAPPTNDFSIALQPASLTLVAGSSGSSTVSTAVTAGSAASVSLTVSGAPSGVTASVSPASVTAGNSSTLTVSTSSSAGAGSSTVTVTGTEGSTTHSATLALTVTSGSGGGGITNGGFETGNLSGWTSTGTTAVVNSGAQSGTYAARVGSTSPSADSSIAQTFTTTSGATGLSFYYNVICPDTVRYDWATATLRDNTTGATTTPLGKTCVNPSSGWRNVTAAVTAGHSYTLTLASHDDNYSGDPTYTLYDSVALTTGGGGGGGGITNGGFETGTFSGWTTAGAHTAIVTAAHTGSYSAMAGNTSPTNGDSTVTQTFTAPAGTTRFSAWYANNCPDTVTYDWATITLRDNTSGTTTTVLGRTCASSYIWTMVTAAVTGGHSYTVTLLNHDDNYGSDPTYTLFDDITVS